MVDVQLCAGGIVFDAARRILLIERGQPPAQGTWSVPGGRCRSGEPAAAACVRELGEETGLVVEVVRFVGRVERDAPHGGVYLIDDFECRLRDDVLTSRLRAGDDAADARWVTRGELATLVLAPGLLDALATWKMLPD